MSILKVCNLQKTYGKEPNIVYALNDVTFSVESGVFGAFPFAVLIRKSRGTRYGS